MQLDGHGPASGAEAPSDVMGFAHDGPGKYDPAQVDRLALECEWLRLTRETLPALAHARAWPVSADHCFQRILLDNALGRCWYEVVQRRPAYRHVEDEALARAVALAQAVIAGEADLHALNANSLAWRGKRGRAAQTSSTSAA